MYYIYMVFKIKNKHYSTFRLLSSSRSYHVYSAVSRELLKLIYQFGHASTLYS